MNKKQPVMLALVLLLSACENGGSGGGLTQPNNSDSSVSDSSVSDSSVSDSDSGRTDTPSQESAFACFNSDLWAAGTHHVYTQKSTSDGFSQTDTQNYELMESQFEGMPVLIERHDYDKSGDGFSSKGATEFYLQVDNQSGEVYFVRQKSTNETVMPGMMRQTNEDTITYQPSLLRHNFGLKQGESKTYSSTAYSTGWAEKNSEFDGVPDKKESWNDRKLQEESQTVTFEGFDDLVTEKGTFSTCKFYTEIVKTPYEKGQPQSKVTATSTHWVSRDHGLVLRIEEKSAGHKSTSELTSYKLDGVELF